MTSINKNTTCTSSEYQSSNLSSKIKQHFNGLRYHVPKGHSKMYTNDSYHLRVRWKRALKKLFEEEIEDTNLRLHAKNMGIVLLKPPYSG